MPSKPTCGDFISRQIARESSSLQPEYCCILAARVSAQQARLAILVVSCRVCESRGCWPAIDHSPDPFRFLPPSPPSRRLTNAGTSRQLALIPRVIHYRNRQSTFGLFIYFPFFNVSSRITLTTSIVHTSLTAGATLWLAFFETWNMMMRWRSCWRINCTNAYAYIRVYFRSAVLGQR